MAVRSSRRKVSFEILSRSSSFEDDASVSSRRSSPDPIRENGDAKSLRESGKRRRRRGSKRKSKATDVEAIPEGGDCRPVIANGAAEDANCVSSGFGNVEIGGEQILFENRMSYYGGASGGSGGSVVTLLESEAVYPNGFSFGELRQRNINGISNEGDEEQISDKKIRVEESASEVSSGGNRQSQGEELQLPAPPRSEPNGNVVRRIETAGSLDWKQLMADDPNFLFAEVKSPLKYFMEEIYGGNSLRSTTTVGNKRERERVYDTIFRLPWRCEALIAVGFFVCLNSFLSLLTIMPIRFLMTFWGIIKKSSIDLPHRSCLILAAF